MDGNIVHHNIRFKVSTNFYEELRNAKQIDFFINEEDGSRKIIKFKDTYQSSSILIRLDEKKIYIVEGAEEDYRRPIYEYYCLSIKEGVIEGNLFHITSLVADDNELCIEVFAEDESCYDQDGRQITAAKVDVGLKFFGKNGIVFISLFHLPYNLIITTDKELIHKIQSEGVWDVKL